eukprot:2400415-Rhodomonas_salina.1
MSELYLPRDTRPGVKEGKGSSPSTWAASGGGRRGDRAEGVGKGRVVGGGKPGSECGERRAGGLGNLKRDAGGGGGGE